MTPAEDSGTVTRQDAGPLRADRDIGPVGTIGRAAIGVAFLVGAVASGNPSPTEWVLGLIVLPMASIAVMSLLRRAGAAPVRWTGPVGHVVNFSIGAVIFLVAPDPALIFYGTALLLAAVRGYAGCEVLAFSNAVRRRSDEVGCAVFSPIDAIERNVS